jgi:hypothetical protein
MKVEKAGLGGQKEKASQDCLFGASEKELWYLRLWEGAGKGSDWDIRV